MIVRFCDCGEPEDGGEFGWFDTPEGETVCNACGSVINRPARVSDECGMCGWVLGSNPGNCGECASNSEPFTH